jgi:hypothetical protein
MFFSWPSSGVLKDCCAMHAFGRWKDVAELVDVPSGCGEVARGEFLFARNFVVTRSAVLTKAERSTPTMTLSLH